MKGDFRSYARAAKTSLLGFGLQLLLGLTLLIYGVISRDSVGMIASYVILITSVVWLIVAIVFDQHRRERIESMEAASLDATAARESSVFGTESDDLRVQAKRLAWMHKVLIPIASIIVGLALISIGAWAYWSATEIERAKVGGAAATVVSASGEKVVRDSLFATYVTPANQGWAISLGLGLAVVGFVFARYTSGMSKNSQWTLLRAGASVSALASLFGLAIALTHFIQVLGQPQFPRWLLLIFPIAAMVLGVEIFINFLLNLYRPRKPGETPRAAFDSWLLGSVASPDQIARNVGGAISYQFGVDVTGSWAYRLLSRSLGGLALIAASVVWLMTTLTVVGPDEQGVVVRLGKRAAQIGPGLHFDYPWPIARVERTKTTALRSLDLATPRPPNDVSHILWTNDHKLSAETKMIVRLTRAVGSGSNAEGRALMVVEIPLIYRIGNLAQWEEFATPFSRESRLRAIALREATQYLSTLDEDQLLAVRRTQASKELKDRIASALTDANAGIEVVFCGIEGVHPPKETANSYEIIVADQLIAQTRVTMAQQTALETLTKSAGSPERAAQIVKALDQLRSLEDGGAGAGKIAEAEVAVDTLIAEARGEVATKLGQAQADRWQRLMSERGRAEAYQGRLAAFRANPQLYYASNYFETLSGLFSQSRVYIVADGIEGSKGILDLKDLGTGGQLFSAPGQ